MRPSPMQWVWFALLSVGAVGHLAFVRSIERRREAAVDGSPYTNLKSLWVFAAILLLPVPLVVAIVTISYAYCWLRVYGTPLVYRKIFSAATFTVASAAASAVLHAGGLGPVPRLPNGPIALLVVVAAGLTWWLVNYALVVGALLLASPDTTARRALGDLADQLIVAAALGLGVGIAALLVSWPWVVPILMLTVVALHRSLLLPQYLRASRTDSKTGLATPTYWSDVLASELRRADLIESAVGVLMVDIDHFAMVNNSHGHPAGDGALLAVARAIRAEVRRDDLVGRWGGDEVAVMLPGVSSVDELVTVAERIRHRVSTTPISAIDATTGQAVALPPITVSIGAAMYSRSGTTGDELLLAADAALLDAKRNGRDQVTLSAGTVADPVVDQAIVDGDVDAACDGR